MMVAQLAGVTRADCIIPKTSAGQGLRAALNLYDGMARVVSTRGEFDSIDVILRHYRERGRIDLRFVEPDARGWFQPEAILAALEQPADLLVMSQVMFMTGQLLGELPAIIAKAHAQGTRVLLDTYHAFGVVPVNLTALNADFAIGGGYKYLRGGPGSCWFYVRPDIVDAGRVPLDTGWFAKEAPFTYQRPDPPRFASGGDGFQESTPPVLIPYQAAAGLELTAQLGVERIRAYGLASSRSLVAALAANGVASEGGRDDMGAFVVIRHVRASAIAEALGQVGIKGDARAQYLRLTPDILTRPVEIDATAPAVAAALRAME
jgi:kynureninase